MQVKNKKTKTVLELTHYLCDVCNDKIEKNDVVRMSGGKGDLWLDCHICHKCTERVSAFIESIGGKVRIFGDEMPCPYNECGTTFMKENVDYIIIEE